jgi:pimeloyl-ACP methyl ester carboxylesterase
VASGTFWRRSAFAAAILVVLAVCALALAIAFGTATPQHSVRPRQLDLAGLPPVSRYAARDGTQLAYRFYPGTRGDIAILIHGTATDSSVMNALARTLNAEGVTVYAPDLRGHGSSGLRGDIAYTGQLDDDLDDLVATIRKARPKGHITLIGFSGGGAFVIRIAGSSLGALFDRFIVIDPAIVYPSLISRPNAGGWATPYLPRIVGLVILDRLGIHAFDGLDTIVFAVPPGHPNLTSHYSFRLMMNLNSGGFVEELQRTKKPMALVAGAADDQFYADRYATYMKPAKPDLRITLVPGLDHVDMLMKPAALAAIAKAYDTLPWAN